MGQSVPGTVTAQATSDATFEAALSQLLGLVGEHVRVLTYADGRLIASSSGELIDAVPLHPGTAEEVVVFRVFYGSTFVLDRRDFRGWHLHLGRDRVDGLDLHLAGDVTVGLTTFAALYG